MTCLVVKMNELKEDLTEISVKIFTDLGFLMPVADENLYLFDRQPCSMAYVDFTGHKNGRLYVKVTNSILPAIAKNILAQDGPPARHLQLDALKEVTNEICGNVLPYLAGSNKVFRLQTPETTDKIIKFDIEHYENININIVFEEGSAQIVWYYSK